MWESGRFDRAGPLIVQPPSEPVRELLIGEALDESQGPVNAGRHAPTRDEIARVDEALVDHFSSGLGKVCQRRVVRARPPGPDNAGVSQEHRPGAR